MASEKKLNIIIDAQNRTQAGFDSVNKNLTKVADNYNQLTSRMRTAGAVGAAAFAGMSVATAGIIRAGADFEQTQIAFETMLGSAEEATRTLANLSSFASRTPFELPQVEEAAKQLIAYGFSTESLIPTMTNLGNVAAGLKIPMGDMAYLFGTLRTQGRAFSKDIYQFTGRGIPIIAELAKVLGVAESEVMGMVEAGRVGFPEVEKAFQNMNAEGGQFYNLMSKQSESLGGLWSNLKDQISLTARVIGTELMPYLKPVVDQLIAMTSGLRAFISENPKFSAAVLGIVLLFTALAALLLPLAIALPGLVLIFGALGAAFTAVATVSGALVLAFIAALGFAIYKIIGIVDILKNDWDLVWLGIKTIAGNAANAVIDTVEGMVNFIISGVNKAIEAINKVIRLAQKVPGLSKISTIKSISNVDFGSIDTDMMAANYNASKAYQPSSSPVVYVTGNTLLDQNAAEKMGDMIMSRLKLSSSL